MASLSIDSAAIEETLRGLECRTNFKIRNLTEYMLSHSKHAFYLLADSRHSRLVLMPALQPFVADFAAIPGVHAQADYCHHAEMTRFPKRLHTGRTETHYGLAFEFDNTKALELFILQLDGIIRRS
ncbi:MAG: hypothetical protein KAX58_08485 [Aeromonadaceae bacterium]|nr:hypothetical protein [Aeromonadaceae bacterium]